MNVQVESGPAGGGPAVGKHETPPGVTIDLTSVMGVRAKLPTPGIAKPLVDTGQAVVPLKMAVVAASL